MRGKKKYYNRVSTLREILYKKKKKRKGKEKYIPLRSIESRYKKFVRSKAIQKRCFEIVYLYSTRTYTYLANDLFKTRKFSRGKMKKKKKKRSIRIQFGLGVCSSNILLSGFYVLLSPLRKIVEIQGLSRQHIDILFSTQ